MGAERRQHERHLVKLKAEIAQPQGGNKVKVTVYTQDLSLGGAFVLLPRDQCSPIGTMVSITVPGTLWGTDESTFMARVVRVTDHGMGLQFFDFDADFGAG
jgi:hypothetical protein